MAWKGPNPVQPLIQGQEEAVNMDTMGLLFITQVDWPQEDHPQVPPMGMLCVILQGTRMARDTLLRRICILGPAGAMPGHIREVTSKAVLIIFNLVKLLPNKKLFFARFKVKTFTHLPCLLLPSNILVPTHLLPHRRMVAVPARPRLVQLLRLLLQQV
jgi:hypothetical protein